MTTPATPPGSSDVDQRVVLVGLYENAPKVYTDTKGRPAGLFVELLDAMARAENWRLRAMAALAFEPITDYLYIEQDRMIRVGCEDGGLIAGVGLIMVAELAGRLRAIEVNFDLTCHGADPHHTGGIQDANSFHGTLPVHHRLNNLHQQNAIVVQHRVLETCLDGIG